ncbi:hypothetical protein AVEN_147951-1 [Araneus ventricosus]|uniref:Uncharacterized protein n=1 Tax=Araneus ventricosus TaxID=182803 RepID=A0A4Y2JDV9_ARAVE|nr:hypothetical protein AVEN_147951-1 [Araneus ventricosus]
MRIAVCSFRTPSPESTPYCICRPTNPPAFGWSLHLFNNFSRLPILTDFLPLFSIFEEAEKINSNNKNSKGATKEKSSACHGHILLKFRMRDLYGFFISSLSLYRVQAC